MQLGNDNDTSFSKPSVANDLSEKVITAFKDPSYLKTYLAATCAILTSILVILILYLYYLLIGCFIPPIILALISSQIILKWKAGFMKKLATNLEQKDEQSLRFFGIDDFKISKILNIFNIFNIKNTKSKIFLLKELDKYQIFNYIKSRFLYIKNRLFENVIYSILICFVLEEYHRFNWNFFGLLIAFLITYILWKLIQQFVFFFLKQLNDKVITFYSNSKFKMWFHSIISLVFMGIFLATIILFMVIFLWFSYKDYSNLRKLAQNNFSSGDLLSSVKNLIGNENTIVLKSKMSEYIILGADYLDMNISTERINKGNFTEIKDEASRALSDYLESKFGFYKSNPFDSIQQFMESDYYASLNVTNILKQFYASILQGISYVFQNIYVVFESVIIFTIQISNISNYQILYFIVLIYLVNYEVKLSSLIAIFSPFSKERSDHIQKEVEESFERVYQFAIKCLVFNYALSFIYFTIWGFKTIHLMSSFAGIMSMCPYLSAMLSPIIFTIYLFYMYNFIVALLFTLGYMLLYMYVNSEIQFNDRKYLTFIIGISGSLGLMNLGIWGWVYGPTLVCFSIIVYNYIFLK